MLAVAQWKPYTVNFQNWNISKVQGSHTEFCLDSAWSALPTVLIGLEMLLLECINVVEQFCKNVYASTLVFFCALILLTI